jgi:hypothetical protein
MADHLPAGHPAAAVGERGGTGKRSRFPQTLVPLASDLRSPTFQAWRERFNISYWNLKTMAGATGLEPATFGVTGHQILTSNQNLFRLFRWRNPPEFGPKSEPPVSRNIDHRQIPKMDAPTPWARQPGRKSKAFWKEQSKSTASLFLTSSLRTSPSVLRVRLMPGAATREVADDAIRNSSTAALPARAERTFLRILG